MKKFSTMLSVGFLLLSAQPVAAQYYDDGYSQNYGNSYDERNRTYTAPDVQRPGSTCLYRNPQGECMVEQYYHEDPYPTYGGYGNDGGRNRGYGGNNYDGGRYRGYGDDPYYSRDYLYYECRQNARNREDFKDCDYYRDEYDYDYFNDACEDEYYYYDNDGNRRYAERDC